MKLKIPVGISDFEEIRRNGYYYIDKSALIRELLTSSAAKVTLITRPRRFGKTLGMSMLSCFLDIRKDSCALFDGLEISEDDTLCRDWMNQWPTLFLSFKDVDGLNFSSAWGMLRNRIAFLCNQHSYLAESSRVNENDRKVFLQLSDPVDGRPTDDMLKTSISLIMHMMQAHYGKPVILLLDEYDVPLAKASSNGYYTQMLEVIRSMMSTALKDNSSLRFAVITGCLKIAKESIFTGTNNFVSDTISGSRLDEYFGFTQDEVEKLLKDTELESHADDIRDWYDGYHFGDVDVYCPWDVLNYIYDLQSDPAARPAGYWKNTSDNAIIRSFIDSAGSSITMKLESLLAGGTVIQKIEEDLTYDCLYASEDNLWSILYLTGYLTRVRESQLSMPLPDGTLSLIIPNTEIRELFRTTIIRWFQDSAKTWDRHTLFHGVWTGDSEAVTREMNKLLRRTISYHDYREDFYHAFLAGIFTGAGYMVESNKEHGEGRSDIVVSDPVNGQAAVFEVKYSKTLEGLADSCQKALQQIDGRRYAEDFMDSFDQVLCYGIAFYKKRCVVMRKN
ncbi:MAG: AAA family ATPase [Lachnospiraceae bacterium]|nr:AAA family ATPase [Lachnospiraceae bacterium]